MSQNKQQAGGQSRNLNCETLPIQVSQFFWPWPWHAGCESPSFPDDNEGYTKDLNSSEREPWQTPPSARGSGQANQMLSSGSPRCLCPAVGDVSTAGSLAVAQRDQSAGCSLIYLPSTELSPVSTTMCQMLSGGLPGHKLPPPGLCLDIPMPPTSETLSPEHAIIPVLVVEKFFLHCKQWGESLQV